jgi:hypothetical protein
MLAGSPPTTVGNWPIWAFVLVVALPGGTALNAGQYRGARFRRSQDLPMVVPPVTTIGKPRATEAPHN